MKIAYFDCPFGAGGDMLLAAILDTGLDQNAWLNELSKISLPHDSYKVVIEQVLRNSITANKIKVLLPNSFHKHQSTDEHHQNRNFKDIASLISNSKISAKAKSLALEIFTNLARAEGAVHGIDPQNVHFHEVGAIDSIIDIVGFAIAYDMAEIDYSIVSPLPLGSGTIKTEHGLFPVPAPATLELISKAKTPICPSSIEYECLTPTAAAILTTIANKWGQCPALQSINATGCGAGDLDPSDHPNICRLILGEILEESLTNKALSQIAHSKRFSHETLLVIETMLDDLSPQILSYTAEQLLKLGAADAYITPIIAKKGRSGQLLTVLCQPINLAKLEDYIFEQTSTIGLRVYATDRLYLNREWTHIDLEKSQIRVKIAKDANDKIINSQPEYEDCAQYAQAKGLPLKTIINLVMEKFNNKT